MRKPRSLRPGHYVCESYGPHFNFYSRAYREAYRGVVDIVWSKGDLMCNLTGTPPAP